MKLIKIIGLSLMVVVILFLLWPKKLIVGIIGLSLLIFGILFLLWQQGRFRRPTTPPPSQGAQPTQPQPSKHWQWNKTVVTPILGSILIIGLIVVVFPNEAKKLLDNPRVIAAIVISIVILAIRWKWWASAAALITLVILLGNNIFIPAAEKYIPANWLASKHSQPQTTQTVHRIPTSVTLPANAVFVKTLAPGEIATLTCASLDAPPPQRWTRGPNGVIREPNWPTGAKSRGLRNTTNDRIELFVVLPPGQSLEPPAAEQKQVARGPVAPTAPAAPAPVPDGKYTWNGRYGYPEDR